MQSSLIAAKKPGPPEYGDICGVIFGIYGDYFCGNIYWDYFCGDISGNISEDIEENIDEYIFKKLFLVIFLVIYMTIFLRIFLMIFLGIFLRIFLGIFLGIVPKCSGGPVRNMSSPLLAFQHHLTFTSFDCCTKRAAALF